MSERLVTPEDARKIANLDGKAQKAARGLPYRKALFIGCGVLTLLVFAGDSAALLETFRFVMVEDETRETPLTVYLLAFLGIIAVFAAHVLWKDPSEAPVPRGIVYLGRVALGLYVLGCGAFLAAMVFTNSTGILAGGGGNDPWGGWLSPGGGGEGGRVRHFFEIYVLPHATAILAAGLGSTFILTIYLAHVLLGTMHNLALRIDSDAKTAKESKRLRSDLMAVDARYVATIRAAAEVTEETVADRLIQHADVIASQCGGCLRPAESMLTDLELEVATLPGGFSLPVIRDLGPQVQKLPPAELEKRIRAVQRAISREAIHAIARQMVKGASPAKTKTAKE